MIIIFENDVSQALWIGERAQIINELLTFNLVGYTAHQQFMLFKDRFNITDLGAKKAIEDLRDRIQGQ